MKTEILLIFCLVALVRNARAQKADEARVGTELPDRPPIHGKLEEASSGNRDGVFDAQTPKPGVQAADDKPCVEKPASPSSRGQSYAVAAPVEPKSAIQRAASHAPNWLVWAGVGAVAGGAALISGSIGAALSGGAILGLSPMLPIFLGIVLATVGIAAIAVALSSKD